ncbi:sulfatase [Acidobacteria bacterium AH-259-O06]|nr:sulfatase [Acidobacteria bacterium AH-259-O06]
MAQATYRGVFLKLLAAAAVAAWLGQFGFSIEGEKDQPNVLFIAIDDLNDWIGCLGGHPDVQTPHLDRLARQGVLFTNAFCSAPACNPSRASLLTGILPSTSGVYLNSQPWRPALRDAQTIPQYFMAHGYRVIGGGKIFHGRYPDPPSWHEYFPSKTKTRPDDPVPSKRPLNGIPNTAHFDWGPLDVDDEDMGDWKVTDWAIKQLGKEHEEPFFLAVGIFRPHLPWYVPRTYFKMYSPEHITLPNVKEDDLEDIPPIGVKMARPGRDHKRVIEYNQWRNAVSAYLASISFTDACVGRLIGALERSPYARNTVIVLWSDHGWHLGEKLHWRKFALWEEATHNVLMMVVPGITQPNARCTRPVSLIDIYPTLIDVCGLRAKEGLEGKSLLPLLKNPSASWDRPALTTHGRNNHSVRSERWRYIRYSDGTEELYDRQKDEMEWTNLADRPEFAKVKKQLARWLPKINAPDAPRERR